MQLKHSPAITKIAAFQSYITTKLVISVEKTKVPTPDPVSDNPVANALLLSK